jgi:enoyl-CoA hydratase/carnithine racemase
VSDSVRYEVRDGVAVVVIDRYDKRNAMDRDVFEGLLAAAQRARDDTSAGAVLVTGEGGVFSAGIDLTVLGGADGGGFDGPIDVGLIARLQAPFTAFEEIDKPVVAAIEGPCFGAGLQLAIACHVRAVAPSASLSVMEVRWGLIPDLGGTYRLPRLIGLGRATELTLTGRRVDAAEAFAMGLAEVALPAEDAQGAALALAAKLAAGPGAVRRAPRLLRENLLRDREAALAAEAAAQLANIAGPDFAEAVTAGMEGRDAVFVGD